MAEPPRMATLDGLLAKAPADGYHLLEVRLAWAGLSPAQSRAAERLRLVVMTLDPLRGVPRPHPGRAAVNGAGEDVELVVYVEVDVLGYAASSAGAPAADVLAAVGESAITVAARAEEVIVSGLYPAAVVAGEVPHLLDLPVADRLPDLRHRRLELVQATPRPASWQPLGLGAIEDLVQDACGPVDLDRSPIVLPAAPRAIPGCPACAKRDFDFPADLHEHLPDMCPAHAGAAKAVSNQRLAAAADSNPEGWATLAEASAEIDETSVRGRYLRRVRDAMDRTAEPEDGTDEAARRDALRDAADLILDMADALEPDEDAALFDGEDDFWPFEDWVTGLVFALGRVGLTDLAVEVGDALARWRPSLAVIHRADTAVVLAEAGRTEEAVARAASNAREHPSHVWAQVHLGDVLRIVGDLDGAERAFRVALDRVEGSVDPGDAVDVYQRIADLFDSQPGREADAAEARRAGAEAGARARRAWRERASRGEGHLSGPPVAGPPVASVAMVGVPRRVGAKVGRNDPCPCGSGVKFKRCCGA